MVSIMPTPFDTITRFQDGLAKLITGEVHWKISNLSLYIKGIAN